MKTHLPIRSLSLVLVSMLAACAYFETDSSKKPQPVGSSTPAESTAEDVVLELSDLQGQFQAKPDTEMNRRVGGWGCTLRDAVIEGERLTLRETDYNDSTCTGKVLGQIETIGTAKLGTVINLSPRKQQLDVVVDSVRITPRDASWAKIFSVDQSGQCQLPTLVLGNTYDVSGLNCKALGRFPNKGQVFYTALSIQDGQKRIELTRFPHEAPSAVGYPGKRLLSTRTTYYKM